MSQEKVSLDQAFDFFKQLAVEGVRPEHIDRVQKNKTLRKQVAELIINGKIAKVVFPVWKTIKLGTGLKSADEFRGALESNGFRIGDLANDILGRPAFIAATKEIEVDLYVLTAAELTGKSKGGTTVEIFAGAARLGFQMCPAEVGPQLRLQYKDQPEREQLFIGMESVADSFRYLHVFLVEHDDSSLWLSGDGGDPGTFWDGHDRWVFLRRPSTRA